MTFVIAFGVFVLVLSGMAIGVMFKRKPIAGSCGGLNAISGADHCLVCGVPVDPDSPLRERLGCAREKAEKEEEAEREKAEKEAHAMVAQAHGHDEDYCICGLYDGSCGDEECKHHHGEKTVSVAASA